MNGTAHSLPPIIAWDYTFAPNAQKSRNYLHALHIPYRRCEQPALLPRPTLTDRLGITYRRIPVLSIGKDVYCDNAAFLAAMQALLTVHGIKIMPATRADRAFDAWGYRAFLAVMLRSIPSAALSPELVKDRATVFPVLSDPHLSELNPSARSELRALLDVAESEFLVGEREGGGPWIGGADECGLADVHAIWGIKWIIQTIGVDGEPGISRAELPRVYRWIESLPKHDEVKLDEISTDDAVDLVLKSKYSAPELGVDGNDVLGFKAGDEVKIDPSDATLNANPQYGKLVRLGKQETVIELDNGLRLHFPKLGYVVRKA